MAWLDRNTVALALFFALCISAIFFVGLGTRDSLDFTRLAKGTLNELRAAYAALPGGISGISSLVDLANDLSGHSSISRLIQSILFQFAGLNERSLIWPAVVIYVANCGLIFTLILRHASRVAALIASMSWAIFAALMLTANQTIVDGMAFVLFFSWMWLFSKNVDWPSRLRNVLLALLLVLLSIENVWFALSLVFYQTFIYFKKLKPFRLLVLLVPLMRILASDIANIDFGEKVLNMLREPALSLILFAALVALIGLKQNQIKQTNLDQFAAFELLAIVAIPAVLLSPDPTSGYLAIAFVLLIIVGQYLAHFIDDQNFSISGSVIVLLLLIQAVMLSTANQRTIPFPGSGSHNIIYLSMIIEGFLFLFWIASGVAMRWEKQFSKRAFGYVLIFLFLSSLIGQTAVRTADSIIRNEAGREALVGMQDIDIENSLAVLYDVQLRDQLIFMDTVSTGRLGAISILTAEELLDTDKKWVLARNQNQDFVADEWRYIESYGQVGKQQISLFERSAEHIPDCMRIEKLISSAIESSMAMQIFPVDLAQTKTCFAGQHLVDRTETLMFQTSGNAYIQPKWNETKQELATSLKYTHLLDPSIFSVSMELAQNTAYIYSVEVLAHEAVTLLYWGTKADEGVFGGGRFDEWREVTVILVTPSEKLEADVNFSPVLFDHFGEVFIRNFYLQELQLSP
jgi:hypothetical protein